MTIPNDQEVLPPDYAYRPDGIAVFSRDSFCESYFHFKHGEHVVFGGPTQRGKTTLAFQLVRHIATPDYPAYVAVSKPSDKTSIEWGEKLGYRRISEFPPTKKIGELKIFNGPPSGYLVWPKFGNIDLDIPNAARVHGKLLSQTYADGAKGKSCVLIMDDTMVKAKLQHLDGKMVTILAMASAMGISLWIFVQKNTDSGATTVWGFEQSTHLFITKGGDKRVLDRYAEIAGDKGPMVKAVVPTLKPFQFLYIHKYEGFACIVDSKLCYRVFERVLEKRRKIVPRMVGWVRSESVSDWLLEPYRAILRIVTDMVTDSDAHAILQNAYT